MPNWKATVFAAFVLFSASAAQAAECDRDCLLGMITKYVEALVAHAPQSLPLAPNARFTEDSKELPLGDGAWKTVTRAGSFRQDYLDVRKGIAASHVELQEEGGQLQYSVVLRIVEQKIAGIDKMALMYPEGCGSAAFPMRRRSPRLPALDELWLHELSRPQQHTRDVRDTALLAVGALN